MPFVLKYASSKLGNAASHPTIGTRTPLRPITIGIAMSAVSSVEEEAPARGASAKTTPTLSAQSRLARNRSLSHKQGQRQKSTQKGDVRSSATAIHVPSETPCMEKAVPKIPQSHHTSQKRRRRAFGIGVSTARSTSSSVVLKSCTPSG